MNDLTATFRQLREALAPLGIELDRDVLALWQDRELHSHEPLPANALKRLAELITTLVVQEPP